MNHEGNQIVAVFPLSGYTPLHHAACWGKMSCLRVLVENGADIHGKTVHGEIPRDIALRYNQAECVDYLDWAGVYILMPTAPAVNFWKKLIQHASNFNLNIDFSYRQSGWVYTCVCVHFSYIL